MSNYSVTAGEIYDEELDVAEGKSAGAFATSLDRRADVAEREGGEDAPAAKILRTTAGDVRRCLGEATIEELDGNIMGQARRGESGFTADLRKVKTEKRAAPSLLDADVAIDLKNHELEHTKQSGAPDVPSIRVGSTRLEAWKVFELGAISVQKSTAFLHQSYKDIAATATITADQRQLIRDGKFRELEQQLNKK
jgi:hypothetical protein